MGHAARATNGQSRRARTRLVVRNIIIDATPATTAIRAALCTCSFPSAETQRSLPICQTCTGTDVHLPDVTIHSTSGRRRSCRENPIGSTKLDGTICRDRSSIGIDRDSRDVADAYRRAREVQIRGVRLALVPVVSLVDVGRQRGSTSAVGERCVACSAATCGTDAL